MARAFADAIPSVDERATHSRWRPGIGPFEEENQIKMIREEVEQRASIGESIKHEQPYPNSNRRVDLLLDDDGDLLPIEAKLIRFRRDNGNIDPNMYKSVFSPFPERSSSTMLTDCQKLVESGFGFPCGVLGLYYEANDEMYTNLCAEGIAEKFTLDVKYWYDIPIETVCIEPFDGLRHPHHQHGAVIAWKITEP
ncbi:transcriptional regulator [Natronococcus amylolyticus]|uniref:transcriptional regulator n=1 Tax=Natronococcus amylolyticus TaxID=44470 RepID=UPI0019D33E35|nr:transcriptional regulator [Natronococcus amylolyticus]